VEERNTQVGLMHITYTRCSRVFAYLGDGRGGDEETEEGEEQVAGIPRFLFQADVFGAFSRHLSGIDEHSNSYCVHFRLPDALEATYFTRIWIIPELILAPSTLFRYSNEEFLALPRVFQELEQQRHWDWHKTPTKWLKFLGKGSMENINLFELLCLTANSQAKDPRDRLFALVSLLPKTQGMEHFRPDYTLSVKHVMAGAGAFCLLNLQEPRILSASTGLAGGVSDATWRPRLGWLGDIQEQRGIAREEIRTELGVDVVQCDMAMGERWDRGIAVDASTGALSLYVVCVLRLRRQPENLLTSAGLYAYKIQGEEWSLILVTRCERLDKLILPGRDSLYMLPVKNFQEQDHPVFLILRDGENPGTFHVVTACCDVYISGHAASTEIQASSSARTAGLTHGALPLLAMSQEFLGQKTPEILERVIWISAKKKAGESAGGGGGGGGDFVTDYLSCIPTEFNPRRRGRYVKFWLEHGVGSVMILDQFKHLSATLFGPRGGQMDDLMSWSLDSIRLRFSGGEWMRWHVLLAKILRRPDLRTQRTKVSIDVDDLEDFFELFLSKAGRYDHRPVEYPGTVDGIRWLVGRDEGDEYWAGRSSLSGYTRALWLASENGLAGLELEDFVGEMQLMGNPGWPQSLLKEFRVDGSTRRVVIC